MKHTHVHTYTHNTLDQVAYDNPIPDLIPTEATICAVHVAGFIADPRDSPHTARECHRTGVTPNR